ncbi:FAD/NAD(P)-binding domain-containing protein [Mycena filopes]|nr:FAD/NAD(P)-binding domain-containing protein [Mycena filopes]
MVQDSAKKSIVIVGGGMLGGSAVARALAQKLPAATATITLVNPLPYGVALPALARMTVADGNDLFETALIPFDKLGCEFVQGVVEGIRTDTKAKAVVLADGREIEWDVLVLAPGARWEGPIDIPLEPKEVAGFVAEQRAKFKKAEKIVLVGGGAVGLGECLRSWYRVEYLLTCRSEFAGEIKDVWPDKEVTIVHGDSGVLSSVYPDRFRKSLAKSLEARGVNILLQDYVDKFPPPGAATVTTRKGSVLEADLVVPTRGPRPRTEFVAKSLGEAALNERGQIRVRPTLQLVGHADIFGVGDAIDTVEQKQAMKTGAHAALVVANVIAYLADASRPLKVYKLTGESIVVTNGRGGGRTYLALLWGIMLGDWFTRWIKSRTLLVSKARGVMGY